MLLGLGGVIYFLVLAETDNADLTEPNGGSSGSGGSSGGPSDGFSSGGGSNPPSYQPKPPKSSPTTKTTDTTAAETTTEAVVILKMLACTFGSEGVLEAMVPPDGMCDVIFYTDVYFQEKRKKIEPMDSTLAFDVLKAKAIAYATTTFGTSMHTGANISKTVNSKKQDLISALDRLFQEKMVHFGMLNVDQIEDYNNLARGALKYLDVVKDFLKSKKPPPTYHCALGVGLTDGTKQQEILDKAVSAAGTFTGITMIVIKVHTEKVIQASQLFPVGPNPDAAMLRHLKVLTLGMISNGLKNRLDEIATSGQGVVRYALLSFAMYARTYRMSAKWANEEDRATAQSSMKMDFALMCKKKVKADPFDPGTVYSGDRDNKFLGLFDTVDTFKAKTATRVQKNLPANSTGLMAYHVEMDDFHDVCGEGNFARLKAIREELFKQMTTP
ncbi:uncharacterized protein LOC144135098 [Amblyomma americanum]